MSNKVWVTWKGAAGTNVDPTRVIDLDNDSMVDDLCSKLVDQQKLTVGSGSLSVFKKEGGEELEVDDPLNDYFVVPKGSGPGQSKDTALFVFQPQPNVPQKTAEKHGLEDATKPAAKIARIGGELLTTEALKAIIKETAKEEDAPRRNILFLEDTSFKLTGRSDTIVKASEFYQSIITQHVNRKQGADKRRIPFPMCCGVPGLGKTRMLEDWEAMVLPAIRVTGIKCKPDYVLVNYYNGHSLQDCEKNGASISVTFAWRLLFDYFLRGRDGVVFEDFMARMMYSNAGRINLSTVLSLIAESHGEGITKDNPLCLFIGVDEYQAVNKLQPAEKEGQKKEMSYARQLATLIGAYMAEPMDKVIILPMFAGTDFDVAPGSVTNSSCVDTKRLPMTVLSPCEVEQLLLSHPQWGKELATLLQSATVRRHLFLLGGIPRFAVEYAKDAIKLSLPRAVADFERVFEETWRSRSAKWSAGLPEQVLLVIAAFAITSTVVAEDGSITVEEKSWSWRKIVDAGVCILEPLSGGYRIVVPYGAFRHCGNFCSMTLSSLPLPHRCLSKSLNYMTEYVDKRVYGCEPWQLWEVFGACFHAARINSFLILKKEEVSVSRLFEGGTGAEGNTQVKLRPMEVFLTSDVLSKDLGETVRESKNVQHSRRWIGADTDSDVGVIVINGPGGAGVDIFFSLPIANTDVTSTKNYMVFLDQRKRVAIDTIGVKAAKSLIAKARAVYNKHTHTAVGLFSMFPRASILAQELPALSFVISKAETKSYHGSFWSHPAACPFVDVQEDNKTTLCLLLMGNPKYQTEVAEEIIARRGGDSPVSNLAGLEAVAKAHNIDLVPDAAAWAVF